MQLHPQHQFGFPGLWTQLLAECNCWLMYTGKRIPQKAHLQQFYSGWPGQMLYTALLVQAQKTITSFAHGRAVYTCTCQSTGLFSLIFKLLGRSTFFSPTLNFLSPLHLAIYTSHALNPYLKLLLWKAPSVW